MKYTNKLNLPQAFINYVNSEEEHEFNPNKYSVTELLGSIKNIILTRKHLNELKIDISETIPALFGTAVHSILEKNAPKDVLTECKLEMKFGEKILAGRVDVLNEKEHLIEDYKTSSTSKVMKADFKDYYLQGMMYAYMTLYTRQVKINKLRFYILMKDWSKIKAINISTYPKSPIYVWEYNINDSDYLNIEEFIKNKFKQIDNGIVDCSQEEMWYTGDKFAVYKNIGDAKAKKVFDTKEEADVYADENKCSYIEFREGEYLKCNHYCEVKEWCNQYGKRD